MNLAALGLICLIAFGNYAAFQLQPNRPNGRPEIVNAFGIVLIALALNIVLPAALSNISKGGVLVWARPFSNSTEMIQALLITLLALGAFCLGFGFYCSLLASSATGGPLRSPPTAVSGPMRISPNAVTMLWILVGFGLLLKLIALVQIGVGPELIARMSGAIRQGMNQVSTESRMTSYLVLASAVADAAAAMLVLLALKTRRRLALAVAVALFCISLTFILSGKRSSLLLPLVLMISAFTAYRRPITVRSLPVVLVALLSFGMATLMLRILAPQSAIGSVLDYRLLGGGSLVDFYLYSPEFAGFDMVVRSVGQGDQIADMFGGRAIAFYRAFLEPFLYVVPRAIWPGKPDSFVDLSHGFYSATFGGGLTGLVGLGGTLIGYANVLGGPFAVAGSFIGLGLLSGWIDRDRGDGVPALVFKAIGIVLAFTMFRQGSLGWTFLIFFQTMSPTILTWILFLLINSLGHSRDFKSERRR